MTGWSLSSSTRFPSGNQLGQFSIARVSNKKRLRLHVYSALNVHIILESFSYYRATACNATHGLQGLSVCLSSVCLSVKRVQCDKTKEACAHIFIPHKNIYSSFLTRRMVGGDYLFYLKFWAKLTLLE